MKPSYESEEVVSEKENSGRASEGGGPGFLFNGEPNLEVLQFDEQLLERWFAIPASENINIEMPRVTFDMLFDAIHRGLQAQIDIVGALQNLAVGEKYDVAAFNSDVLPSVVEAMNSLRRYQGHAMSEATGLDIDYNLKVTGEAVKNG